MKALSIALGLTLVMGVAPVSADPIRFLTARAWDFGPQSPPILDRAAGDFDGDGDLDIAETVNNSVRVRTNVAGTFAGVTTVMVGEPFTEVEAGDLNGDSRPDLVACGPAVSGGRILVAFNTGSGFAVPVSVPTDSTGISDVALADLDGDGDLDLVAVNRARRRVHRLSNDGNGTFSGLTSSGHVPAAIAKLWVADFTNDHLPDILTGWAIPANGSNEDYAHLQINLGSGIFSAPANTGVRRIVAVGQFGGDASLDLFASTVGSPSISGVARGRGDGTFDPPAGVPAFPSSCGEEPSGAAIDVDGDGRDELLYAMGAGCGVSCFALLRIDAAMQVTQAGPIYLGSATQAVLVLDADGDGDPDAITTNCLVHPNVNGRLGGARGIHYKESIRPLWEIFEVDVADMSGDGRNDVMFSTRLNGSPLFLARPDGAFGPGFNVANSYTRNSYLLDLDGDGDRDIWSNHKDSGMADLAIWLNDGTGHAASTRYLTLPTPQYTYNIGISIADFDGDGDPDGLTELQDGSRRVYLNDGFANFTWVNVALPYTGTYLDLNEDGLPDRLTASGDSLTVELATAFGTLGPAVRDYAGGTIEKSLFLDVTGDGVTDAVSMLTSDQIVTRIGIAGGGWGPLVFTPSPTVPAGDAGLGSIADLDADGAPDIVVAGTGVICALRNIGGGLFGERGDSYTTQAFGTQVADMDNDSGGDVLGIEPTPNNHPALNFHYSMTPAVPPTAVLVSNVAAEGLADRARLVWQLGGDAVSSVTVERRDSSSDWTALGTFGPEGDGRIAYDDFAVAAGTRYGYRLAVAGEASPMGEVWVTIPTRTAFGIEHVWPNPTTSDRLSVRFAVEHGGPVEVELIDIAGRRVESRTVVAPAPGTHEIQLGAGRSLGAGLYLVQISQNGRRAQSKVALVR